MLSLVMKDQLKIIELYYTEESIKSIITGKAISLSESLWQQYGDVSEMFGGF